MVYGLLEKLKYPVRKCPTRVYPKKTALLPVFLCCQSQEAVVQIDLGDQACDHDF